jgi:hypothetical protein
MITEGGHLRLFSEFKIINYWPEKSSSLNEELLADKNWIAENCVAGMVDNSWVVSYMKYGSAIRYIFAYYFGNEANEEAKGPYQIDVANVSSGPYEYYGVYIPSNFTVLPYYYGYYYGGLYDNPLWHRIGAIIKSGERNFMITDRQAIVTASNGPCVVEAYKDDTYEDTIY